MTRTYAAVFDGTAALKARPAARLVLIEGGLRATPEPHAEHARLSLRQLLALIVLGVSLIAAICVASVVSDGLARSARAAALSGVTEREVVVSDGDSLWSIASCSGVEGAATSDVVTWISERNGLDGGLIRPGQRLVVPASSR